MDATVILVLAALAGLYMAWNIGANDVANAMGTSVGSGALTHKQAVVLAGILEFCGAFLVGAHVTETVQKKMIEPTTFAPDVLMLGMVAALLGAGTWLLVATALGRPVSTTHSIVGAVFGFGLVVGGVHAVNWQKIGEITASWIVSPILSGAVAYVLFSFVQRTVINSLDPVRASLRWGPVFVFTVFWVMTLVTIFKGLKNLHLDLSLHASMGIATLVGLVAAAIGSALIRRGSAALARELDEHEGVHSARVERGLRDVSDRLAALRPAARGELAARLEQLEAELAELSAAAEPAADQGLHLDPELRFAERVFGTLQILSASFVAFAHGSNDVANAVGPVAAVAALAHSGSIADQATVPTWVLFLGASGIVLGLATFGHRVMATIGRRITELTPSRGFSAEFAAATTIVLASRLGLPVSTTHVLVGAVMGVGLARGLASLNPKVMWDILVAWAIEIPAAALLCVVFYQVLQWLF